MVEQRKSAGMPDQMIEIANKLRTTLITRCQADNWPQPVLDCYAKATDQQSIRNCRNQLPPDQAQKLQAEIIQSMTGGAGAGGMPPGHGGAAPATDSSATPPAGSPEPTTPTPAPTPAPTDDSPAAP